MFLDIKKAYDSMWKDGLLIKLHDAVINCRMFYWIKDFLNNRSIQVKIMGDLAALNILLYDCQVERIQSLTFLGLWMDSRLTRKGNVEKVVCECEKVTNILQSLAGSDCGAERDTLVMINHAMIRSILDNGCVIFGSATKSVLCNCLWKKEES